MNEKQSEKRSTPACGAVWQDDDTDRWVIVDQTGAVMYENDELELGWQDEHEALTAARGLESRGEGRWLVVREEQLER